MASEIYYRGSSEATKETVINYDHFATTNFSPSQLSEWTWNFRIILILFFFMDLAIVAWPVSITVLYLLEGWITWWLFTFTIPMLFLCLAVFNSQPYHGFITNNSPQFWRLLGLYKQIPPLHLWILFTWLIAIIGFLWAIGIAIPWILGKLDLPLWLLIVNEVIIILGSIMLLLQTKLLYSWGLAIPYRTLASKLS